MEREAERDAFSKACAYLNYNAGAKWAAYLAAASTGLIYIALLAVLWLFVDLLVHRGQFPTFRTLPPADQNRFLNGWRDLDPEERVEQLREVGFGDRSEELAKLDPTADLSREQLEDLWRAHVAAILKNVSPRAAARVTDEPNVYDEPDNGLLSLVVRAYARGSTWQARVGSWLARWNGWWAWNRRNETSIFAPYLNGLLIIGLVLALLGAAAAWWMGEMAARACIEATNRLRRAVYLHTFRLGTLAFRALGPAEAVTVFSRHIEAVNDALLIRLTVYFREAIQIILLVVFALLIHVWLGVAFLTFAVLVWMIGGQVVGHFTRQGRQATNEGSERLTEMRESLMMMRLVKCYMMEPFNRARVERQPGTLCRRADAASAG